MANSEQDKRGNGQAGPGSPGAPGGAEAYGRWVEQMQRSRGRHAAITRNLYTWSNYKSWAEKVRSDWDPESGK